MRRDELTDADARRILAGMVRNFLPTTRVAFAPWQGFYLIYEKGFLCRVDASGADIPLFATEEVYGKSDEELEALVFRHPLPRKATQTAPAPLPVLAEEPPPATPSVPVLMNTVVAPPLTDEPQPLLEALSEGDK